MLRDSHFGDTSDFLKDRRFSEALLHTKLKLPR